MEKILNLNPGNQESDAAPDDPGKSVCSKCQFGVGVIVRKAIPMSPPSGIALPGPKGMQMALIDMRIFACRAFSFVSPDRVMSCEGFSPRGGGA